MPKLKTKVPKVKTFLEQSFWERLMEVSKFFAGKAEVFKSLRRIVRRRERADISYAVVGGIAVLAHRYRRPTHAVDILLRAQGCQDFNKRFVPRHYAPTP